jgi:hypothetical protein
MSMCLSYGELVFLIEALLLAVALGTSGLLWLVVRLAKHMQSKIDLERSLKSYE